MTPMPAESTLNSPLIASDIMTSRLITLQPEMSSQEAMQVLSSHQISGAPVINSLGELVGVVSLKDLLANSEYQLPSPSYYDALYLDDLLNEEAFELVNLNSGTVLELMNPDVITVDTMASIASVAKTMYTHRVHRVIVVAHILETQEPRPTGIISTFDLLKVLSGQPLLDLNTLPLAAAGKIPAQLGV